MSEITLRHHIINYANLLGDLEKQLNTKVTVQQSNVVHFDLNQQYLIHQISSWIQSLYFSDLPIIDDISNNLDLPFANLAGHMIRTALLAFLLGSQMDSDNLNLRELTLAALIHDIGKLVVPKQIIDKPSSLTDDEFALVKSHTTLGYDMIVGELWLSNLTKHAVCYHHERLDGSGYPLGIKKADIPHLTRVVSIADAFDAMSSRRPYKETLDYIEAYKQLRLSSHQYDSNIFQYLAPFCIEPVHQTHSERRYSLAFIYG